MCRGQGRVADAEDAWLYLPRRRVCGGRRQYARGALQVRPAQSRRRLPPLLRSHHNLQARDQAHTATARRDPHGEMFIHGKPKALLELVSLLALGCRTGPLQPDERAVLEAAMADSEPLVAEAATWAAKRRGLNVDESAPRDR